MVISLVAVLEKSTRAIGLNNKLLWRLPEDMKRFVGIRKGKPVIMGRKTWESIPDKFKPLKGSLNIVLTSDTSYSASEAIISNDVQSAILYALKELLKNSDESFENHEIVVMGGAQIYKEFLPRAQRLYLTLVDDPDVARNSERADAFFPPYKHLFKRETHREETSDGGFRTTFVILENI